MLKLLQSFFSVLSGFFRSQERREDQLAGANKVKVATLEKQAGIHKDADGIWRSKPRNRLRRDKGEGGD
jgi:hypothetical protein